MLQTGWGRIERDMGGVDSRMLRFGEHAVVACTIGGERCTRLGLVASVCSVSGEGIIGAGR
jgi:hypothetical protein